MRASGQLPAQLATKLSTDSVRRRLQRMRVANPSRRSVDNRRAFAAHGTEDILVFDHSCRGLADLAVARLFGAGACAGHRAIHQPEDLARPAAQAARRGHQRVAQRPCPAPTWSPSWSSNSGARAKCWRPGFRALERQPALHRRRSARRHGGRRPRGRASARALPAGARHHRLGRAAARPAGHGDRHDRDLRLAVARPAARSVPATRRSSRTASRSRSTTPPSA